MLKFIFSVNKKYDTAIEIDKSYLKISEADVSKKNIVISKLITRPISGFSDAEISKQLADVINESRIRAGEARVIVPREKAMMRYLRLPATNAEEIDSMVSFEIAKQIPYSAEEVISDYKVVDTDEQGYSYVMVVVAHKDEIARIDNILGSAKIGSCRIRLSSEEIINWLKIAVPLERLTGKHICLIDIDSDNTEIIIVSNENLVFSRVTSTGAVGILKDKAIDNTWAIRLIDEIRRTIGMYTKQAGKDKIEIAEFLITGASSVIEDFTGILQKEIETPCHFIDSLSALSLENDALSDEGISPDTSICAVCGGPFILGGVNLIPQELRKKQKLQAKIRKLAGVALSVIFIFAMMSAVAWLKVYQKERLLGQLESMYKQIEPTATAAEEKTKRLRVLKKQLSEGASSLDAIYHLYRLMPANIFLIDFDYDDNSRLVSFRGRAPMMSDVFKVATALESSEKFSNVQTRSMSKRQTQQGETVDFQIRCNFIMQRVNK